MSRKGSGMDSSARSLPQRGNSLRILLRSSLLAVEKPCPLSRPRTSSSTPFALGLQESKKSELAGGFLLRQLLFEEADLAVIAIVAGGDLDRPFPHAGNPLADPLHLEMGELRG
jgi:hypothetical protein